jgi:hypothetical protein
MVCELLTCCTNRSGERRPALRRGNLSWRYLYSPLIVFPAMARPSHSTGDVRDQLPACEVVLNLRPGRFWDFVLWSRNERRANDAGNLWCQLPRVYGADRPGFPLDTQEWLCRNRPKGQRYPRRSGTKHLKFRAFSATSSQKRLSGLLVRPSLHCPRSERQVSSSRISELRTYAAGNLDVEIRDPRCRFSGFRGNSRCCRPPTAPAGRLHCSSRQISHRQEPRRQIPCREGACGDHQGLI